MKTFLPKAVAFFFLYFYFFNSAAKAQGVHFVDGYFEGFVVTQYPSCVYPDGSIDVTCSAITSEDTLDLRGFNVSVFDGLQYFISLRYLDISGNASGQLGGDPISLPLPASLKTLKCSNINSPYFVLQSLPPNLEYLDCSGNENYGPSEPFPGLPATLKYLNCSNDNITQMLALPPSIDTLICHDNAVYHALGYCSGISSFSSFPATLKYLDCGGNKLTSLPALPAGLTYLDCSNNEQEISTGPNVETMGGITALPSLPPNLKYLSCGRNYITTIPALPSTLEYFSHSGLYTYQLTSLPALPAVLRTLSVSGDNLSALPPLPDSLRTLIVAGNYSLACLPHLPAHLTELTCYNTAINCIPNTVNGLSSTITTLCTISNNSNLCNAFPVLSGHVFYDNNSNGIKEPSENYRPNIGIRLSSGLETYSNTNGFYNVTADTGTNSLTVAPPRYYNAVPATANFNIASFTGVFSQDIALQPNTNVDSLLVNVTPLWVARPGFEQAYAIDYENVGTTVVSPATVLHYDNSRLVFLSASNPAVTDNGNSLGFSESNFTPGQHGGYTANFQVKPTAIAGDTIFVNVSATAGSITVKDSSYTQITSSFDPNDKNSTPKLSPQQVLSGKAIDYIIRFQNTGTDTAFNIVITDVLDNNLDAASFEMTRTSHPCKVTRNVNSLGFEFLHVLIPDITTNEAASHGYIRFRVKPKQTVVTGNVIPNKANIYFDFNSPVLTNTTNTVIQLTTVPLNLLSFKVLTGADNSALLSWNTSNEMNTAFFDIEQSTDNKDFTGIGTITARGTSNNAYTFKTTIDADIVYYRLKIIDTDRKFSYSQVLLARKNKHAASLLVLNNPAKNTLNIITRDGSLVNSTANMFNQQGMPVQQFILKDGLQTLDVSKLAAGIYYLKAGSITQKLVINN